MPLHTCTKPLQSFTLKSAQSYWILNLRKTYQLLPLEHGLGGGQSLRKTADSWLPLLPSWPLSLSSDFQLDVRISTTSTRVKVRRRRNRRMVVTTTFLLLLSPGTGSMPLKPEKDLPFTFLWSWFLQEGGACRRQKCKQTVATVAVTAELTTTPIITRSLVSRLVNHI